ncbi:hypothetical protein J002_05843 [Cryptococcus neoformans]|nr:hypothetical protein J002_05843 [Cryptococcus neoformans var. grubii]OXH65323.1 hypothetical protein J000_05864 [Cryptococcus neoformans var. grubii]
MSDDVSHTALMGSQYQHVGDVSLQHGHAVDGMAVSPDGTAVYRNHAQIIF